MKIIKSLFRKDRNNTVLVGWRIRDLDPWSFYYFWIDRKIDGVKATLGSSEAHWVIRGEAKANVPVGTSACVTDETVGIATWDHLIKKTEPSQLARAQEATLFYGREVLLVREVIEMVKLVASANAPDELIKVHNCTLVRYPIASIITYIQRLGDTVTGFKWTTTGSCIFAANDGD